MLVLGLVAAIIGGQLNHAIYRWGWHKRAISPWSAPPPGAARRRWPDYLPILGWWFLRRESTWHGPVFWVRPALIEIACVVGGVFFYFHEMSNGLLPIGAVPQGGDIVWQQLIRHLVLIALLIIATFIDLDEQSIPDEVTVLGTWLGLVTAVFLPAGLLPSWSPLDTPMVISPLSLSVPWNTRLDGMHGLAFALVAIAAWWYALVPKTLWYRGGWVKFVRFLTASIARHRWTRYFSIMAIVMAIGTALVFQRGGASWKALLSAYAGLVVGGGIIWAVRLVGSLALRQEAMGFGDVTLMGMIGTYVGWQPTLMVFFLAPFAGLVIALLQLLITGRKDIAYGPFLSLATLIVLVAWPLVWTQWLFRLLEVGLVLMPILGGALVILGGLLLAWRVSRRATV